MSWPFSSPDSFDGGFWTSRPGSLDFCEENYVHSPYIAETTNTFSNLSYIVLALYGIRSCRSQRLPTRFLLCNFCLLCVGIGSTAYHATLRNWAQSFDEVPMLYTVGFITYTTFDTTPSRRVRLLLPIVLCVIACGWTAAYIKIETPEFHELSFAALVLLTTIRVLFLLRSLPLRLNPMSAHQICMLYYQGSAMFVSGFVVWNLDNWYCAALRTWRADAGWPAPWIAQGHAYWHIATAVGAYRMIVASEFFFLIVTQRPGHYMVEGSFFPIVRRMEFKTE